MIVCCHLQDLVKKKIRLCWEIFSLTTDCRWKQQILSLKRDPEKKDDYINGKTLPFIDYLVVCHGFPPVLPKPDNMLLLYCLIIPSSLICKYKIVLVEMTNDVFVLLFLLSVNVIIRFCLKVSTEIQRCCKTINWTNHNSYRYYK